MIPEIPSSHCLVCGESLDMLPQTSCPRCATLHHQKCWDYNGGCAVYGYSSHNTKNVPDIFSGITPEEREIVYRKLTGFFNFDNLHYYFPEKYNQYLKVGHYYLFLPIIGGLIIFTLMAYSQWFSSDVFAFCGFSYLILLFSLSYKSDLRMKSLFQVVSAEIDTVLASAIADPIRYEELLSFTWQCIEDVRESKKKMAVIRSMITEMKAKENGDE